MKRIISKKIFLKLFGIILVSLYSLSIFILCGEYIILPVGGKIISIAIDQIGFLLDINWMVNDAKSPSMFEIDWMH